MCGLCLRCNVCLFFAHGMGGFCFGLVWWGIERNGHSGMLKVCCRLVLEARICVYLLGRHLDMFVCALDLVLHSIGLGDRKQ